jgi:putative Mg2+ transporter-C (MgtC) family protein
LADVGLQLELVARLVVALVLGGAVGLEREITRHPAGIRTMALVAAGACLFSSIGEVIVKGGQDPTRIAAQVVTGIGFLGAGAILRQRDDVRGLTTAASTWAVAAIGMAVGFRLYVLAVVATVMVLIALAVVGYLERQIVDRARRKPGA